MAHHLALLGNSFVCFIAESATLTDNIRTMILVGICYVVKMRRKSIHIAGPEFKGIISTQHRIVKVGEEFIGMIYEVDFKMKNCRSSARFVVDIDHLSDIEVERNRLVYLVHNLARVNNAPNN